MKVMLPILILCCLVSCGKQKMKNIKCGDSPYGVNTVGFTEKELDTISVKWYEVGSSYTKLVDSHNYHFNWAEVFRSGDTLFLPFYNSSLMEDETPPFDANTEIEINLPVVKKKYRIGGIKSSGPDSQHMQDYPRSYCTDPVAGYHLDGKYYDFPKGGYPNVYLVK